MSKAAEQFLRAMSPGLSGLEPDSHPPGRRRFSRQARLLKHSEFDRTYKGGRRHFAKHMTMFYLVRTAESPVNGRSGPRVGLTVGRALGNAVDRNRIKRRLREAVRQSLSVLTAGVDVVINPKKSALSAEFSEIQAEVQKGFETIAARTKNIG